MNKKAWIALILSSLVLIIGACSVGTAVNNNRPNNKDDSDVIDDSGTNPPASSEVETGIVLDITTIYF